MVNDYGKYREQLWIQQVGNDQFDTWATTGGLPLQYCFNIIFLIIKTVGAIPPWLPMSKRKKIPKKQKKCMVNDYGKYREQLWI